MNFRLETPDLGEFLGFERTAVQGGSCGPLNRVCTLAETRGSTALRNTSSGKTGGTGCFPEACPVCRLPIIASRDLQACTLRADAKDGQIRNVDNGTWLHVTWQATATLDFDVRFCRQSWLPRKIAGKPGTADWQ